MGVRPRVLVRKMAVPGTVMGGRRLRDSTRASWERADWSRRARTSFRPVAHVVMTAKMRAPVAMGNQPPWKNLVRLAARKPDSMMPKIEQTVRVAGRDQRQRRRATKPKRMVVMSIVMVTATP